MRSCRGPAIRSSSSVQLPVAQSSSWHIHRRLRHTSRAWPSLERQVDELRPRVDPSPGRARRTTDSPSIERRSRRESCRSPPGPSSTPRNVMSGSPIIHTSARGGSVSTGVLHLRSSNNQRLVDPRDAARGSDYETPLRSEVSLIRSNRSDLPVEHNLPRRIPPESIQLSIRREWPSPRST